MREHRAPSPVPVEEVGDEAVSPRRSRVCASISLSVPFARQAATGRPNWSVMASRERKVPRAATRA